MRKINYKLNIVLIGKESIVRDIILHYLKKMGNIKSDTSSNDKIIEVIHEYIPIKIHLKAYETINELTSDLDPLNGFDFLFLILNIYDRDSFYSYRKEDYDEVSNKLNFRGSSLLVAIAMDSINNAASLNKIRISRHQLIRKCNELDLEYCFEIIDPEKDLQDLFKKIFDESITRFRISKPEMYEKVKELGKALSKKVKKI